MPSNPDSLRFALHNYRTPLIIAAVGVTLSIAGFVLAVNAQMNALKRDFIAQSHIRAVQIDRQLSVFREKMDAVRGVVQAGGSFEGTRRYAETIIARIPYKFIGWIKNGDDFAFSVFPPDSKETINLKEIARSPDILKAYERARLNKGHIALSYPLTIKTSRPADRLMAIVAPLLGTARGYSIGLISLEDLFASTSPSISTIYLYRPSDSQNPIYTAGYIPSHAQTPLDLSTIKNQALFYHSASLVTSQGRWTLLFIPAPGYLIHAIDIWAWLVLISGLIITGLISVVTFQQATQHLTVSHRVDERTAELGDVSRRLQGVLDTVIDGIITFDDHGRIQSFNPGAERIFGYRSAEVLGQNINLLTPALYNDMEPQAISLGREVEGRHKNGDIFPLELGVNEMWIDNRRAFVGSIRDISERKRAMNRVTALVEKLSESNSELERFAYVASHDLQEPLRMITNFNELLSKRYADKLDMRAAEYIRISTDAAMRMSEMIRDLLEYARLNTDAERTASFSANTEMTHVLLNLNDAIAKQEAEIQRDRLPTVTGNPIRFVRLMQNLVGNGLKYQPNGQKPIIRISAEKVGPHWQFCVRDNGIGMQPEYLEQIFLPFKRLHSNAQYTGTGIGLAVCKRIVESWGGKIWVESTPGQGSQFFFTMLEADE